MIFTSKHLDAFDETVVAVVKESAAFSTDEARDFELVLLLFLLLFATARLLFLGFFALLRFVLLAGLHRGNLHVRSVHQPKDVFAGLVPRRGIVSKVTRRRFLLLRHVLPVPLVARQVRNLVVLVPELLAPGESLGLFLGLRIQFRPPNVQLLGLQRLHAEE